jgi:hypothetical protein
MLKALTITLRQEDGTDKTYSTDFISGKMLRRAMEIRKHLQDIGENPKALSDVYTYFSDAFNKQFTAEDFEDGIDSRVMTETITKYINAIITKTAHAIGGNEEGENSPN